MKDIKHIRRDFHLAAWVMPQGWDLGVLWEVVGSNNFLSRNSTSFGVLVTPWGPGEGPKGQISLNLNYKVNFKDF